MSILISTESTLPSPFRSPISVPVGGGVLGFDTETLTVADEITLPAELVAVIV